MKLKCLLNIFGSMEAPHPVCAATTLGTCVCVVVVETTPTTQTELLLACCSLLTVAVEI